MITTIVKRLLQGLVVLIAIMTVTFFLLRLLPGDPSRTMAPVASEKQLILIKEEMGIGESIPKQFVKYIKNLSKGYLGYSFFQKADVIEVIKNALPKTGLMLLITIGIQLVFGISLGLLAAIFANSWIDKIISGIAVIFQSMPNYWIGLMLISIVTVKLRLLPSVGYQGPIYAVLPAIVLSLQPTAVLTRSVRASIIGSMNQEFVKAATARGIPWTINMTKYVFRNSLIPLLTLFGAQIGYLVGGSAVVELIFGYPGIGLQTVGAILRRDYYLVQGLVVLMAGFFVVINTLVDIGYIYLDPRVRKSLGGL